MEITKKEILKHYFASVVVYGIILLLLIICPMFNQNIRNPYFNHITVLILYYVLYVIFAYFVLLKFKPQTIKESRNVVILKYFGRQFKKGLSLTERLNNIEPCETEKQGFVILFIKAFFGIYCLNLLCNEFLPSLGYNIDFMKTIFVDISTYVGTIGVWSGVMQFIDDSADVMLSVIFTVITLIFAISYLTETKFFGNKIKYADTTPLGLISCLACFYPFILITNQIVPTPQDRLIPVENNIFRLILYIFVILANLGSLIALFRLGAKSGNLTNRGIVTGFPYNIVRHPDYSMQIVYIILTTIPVCINTTHIIGKILYIVGAVFWIFIYYLRAITEERNLIKDEQYIEYSKRVRHRFIRGIV